MQPKVNRITGTIFRAQDGSRWSRRVNCHAGPLRATPQCDCHPMCSTSLCGMRQRGSSWQEVAKGLQALAEGRTRALPCEPDLPHSQLPPIHQPPLRLGFQEHKKNRLNSWATKRPTAVTVGMASHPWEVLNKHCLSICLGIGGTK